MRERAKALPSGIDLMVRRELPTLMESGSSPRYILDSRQKRVVGVSPEVGCLEMTEERGS